MANLEGLGRIQQALRLLDDIDSHYDKESPERARTAALRPRLYALALRSLESDLDAMEQQPTE